MQKIRWLSLRRLIVVLIIGDEQVILLEEASDILRDHGANQKS